MSSELEVCFLTRWSWWSSGALESNTLRSLFTLFSGRASFSRLTILSILARKARSSGWPLFSLGPWRPRPARLSRWSWHSSDGHWWTGNVVQDGAVASHVTWGEEEPSTPESRPPLVAGLPCYRRGAVTHSG